MSELNAGGKLYSEVLFVHALSCVNSGATGFDETVENTLKLVITLHSYSRTNQNAKFSRLSKHATA